MTCSRSIAKMSHLSSGMYAARVFAALHVPEIKFSLRTLLRASASPEHAMTHLNDRLCTKRGCEGSCDPPLAAVSIVVLNRATGAGACCVAGADPPLILGQKGLCTVLPAAGLMLGVCEGQAYIPCQFRLATGEGMLLVTDGITEARRKNEFLGYDGMTELVMQAWAAGKPGEASPHALAHALLRDAHRFANGSLHDDASILVAERLSA